MKKQNLTRKLQIGVIGSAGPEEYSREGGASKLLMEKAKEIGFLLAKKGIIVITGGKSGVMEAAAKGAKESKGITVGVIKGKERFKSNNDTDIEVVSGAEANGFDEFLLVLMSDALIVIGGGAGTLEEMAIAYRNNKPIVVLDNSGGWAEKLRGGYLDERRIIKVEVAKTPREAVIKAIKLAKKNYAKIK